MSGTSSAQKLLQQADVGDVNVETNPKQLSENSRSLRRSHSGSKDHQTATNYSTAIGAILESDINTAKHTWDQVLQIKEKAVSFLATAMKEQQRLVAMFEKWNIDAIKQAHTIFDMWGSLIADLIDGS